MRHNGTNKTTTPPPLPCYMRHSQSFDKIDSFLKLVSNIFILRNLIVRLGGGGGGGAGRGY